MNGDPFDPRVSFLVLALEQAVIVVDDEALDTAIAVLVVEVHSEAPDPARIATAWDHVIAALVKLEQGCVGGPLLALIFSDMNDLAHVNRGPFDLCLALALLQALPLLPSSDVLDEAVSILIEGAEAWPPASFDDEEFDGVDVSRLDMEVAHLLVTDVLQHITEREIGGALAVLLLQWVHHRPVC